MRVVERPRFRAARVSGLRRLRRRRRRRPGPGPVRPAPVELPAPRPGRGPLLGDGRPAGPAGRLRVGRPSGRRPAGPGAGVLRRPRRHAPPAAEPAPKAGTPTADTWRRAFFDMPYLRDGLVAFSAIAETFETAVTWDRFPALHAAVKSAVRETLGRRRRQRRLRLLPLHPRLRRRPGALLHRRSPPAGPAPSSSSGRRSRRPPRPPSTGAGGTATHHHAVGRDHRPAYDRERPDLFAAVLRAAKATLDPAGVLNPGVVFDPE